MSSVVILTDNTAQFSKPVFPGRNLVEVLPLRSHFNNLEAEPGQEVKVSSLPASARNGLQPCLEVPTPDEFRQIFTNLSLRNNEIVALLHSSQLSPAVENALEAAESVRGRVAIQVIDSQSTSVGLGYLVQAAADAAQKGSPSTEIERLMRGLIPHIYSVFCIPGLSYLHFSGFLGMAQAQVGEMLGLLPIFTLEDGHLTPLEKVRNPRHLLDFMQEFLDEFSELHQIAIIQSVPPMVHEVRTLREHATTNFPKTPFSEHPISLPLATLFGPRTLGVFAIEMPDPRSL